MPRIRARAKEQLDDFAWVAPAVPVEKDDFAWVAPAVPVEKGIANDLQYPEPEPLKTEGNRMMPFTLAEPDGTLRLINGQSAGVADHIDFLTHHTHTGNRRIE